jgi:subtilisin-like proprotein convertase family protein
MKNFSFGDMFDRAAARESKKARFKQGRAASPKRVRLWLDNLEERTVPAATPVLPEVLVSNSTSISAGFSPQVAINPLNSNWIVEVHATATGPAGSFTLDGGQTWSAIAFPTQPGIDPNTTVTAVYDPSIYKGPGAAFYTPYAVTEDVGIAFDKQGNFYVISNQHNTANDTGAIILQKFSTTGIPPGVPEIVSTQTLFAYRGQDQAYNPVIAINTNEVSYTDPQSTAANTTALATAVAPTDLAINVASAANFPPAPFAIQVGTEQMQVTAVLGNSLVVTRGINGTAAVPHLAAASVTKLNTVTDTLAGQAFLANTKTTAVALTPTDTTINVLNAANLPAAVPYFIQVNNEQMKVTRVVGNALTVVRGVNGTTAAAHLPSTTVATLSPVPKGIFVAWSVNTTQTPNVGLPDTVSRIVTMVSPDGGATFTTQQRVSPRTFGTDMSNPKIVFSSSGGQLNFFYDFDEKDPLADPQNGVILDSSRPDGGVANAAAAATQTFVQQFRDEFGGFVQFGGGIDDATTSSSPITTTTNNAIAAGANFVFVDYDPNYPTAPFAVGDRFRIAINPTTNEEFRITNIITGSRLIVADPGVLATPPAANTISVASNAAFQVGDLVQVDAEIMLITAIAGGTLTVNRAQGGTLLAPHAANATVTNISQTRWNIVGGQNSTTPTAHPAGSVIQKLASTSSQPVITSFTQDVLIDAANLTTIKDLDVRLSLVHPNLDNLRIELVPPLSSGLQPITLVDNRLDADGNVRSPVFPPGITGENLGVIELGSAPFIEYNSLGTVFSTSADRSINASNASAPYIGYFRPEGLGLDNVIGRTNVQLSGTWTLRITDFVNDTTSPPFPTQFVASWGLNFTGVVSTDRIENPDAPGTFIHTNAFGEDANTGVGVGPLPSVTNVYPQNNTATGPAGFGQGVSIAVDNTLGGFSPYQGRMYMAYNVGGNGIGIVTSDDNGLTWSDEVRVDDDAASDNFSEGNRPQFTPTVTVDRVTGTVVVSYYDARNDAARARVATSIVASIDGGKTFSKVAYANPKHTAIDFLTGKLITVEPIPGNQPAAGALGFGDRQGLVAFGGRITPVFASNENSGGSSIFTARVTTSAGPRVIYGDTGVVNNTFTSDLLTGVVSYNNTFAADGTRQLDGFLVQFDRPIDIATFTASDVVVQHKDAVTGAVTFVPLHAALGITPLDTPQNASSGFGPNRIGIGTMATQFLIRLATPQSKPGTYSYSIGDAVYDRIRAVAPTIVPVVAPAPFNAPFVSTGAVPIVDATGVAPAVVTTPTVSTIPVPALPFGQVIAGVTVNVNIAHDQVGDLDLYLVSPRGNRILLSNRNGTIGVNYTNTTFSDAGFFSIVSGFAPFNGTFRPEQSLSQLIGQEPAGDWSLEVTDRATGFAGTINSWRLNFTIGRAINGNEMDQNANALAGEAIAYVPGGNASTLTAAVAAADTSLSLAAVAGFPAAPFVVQVGNEQMLVTGITGNTFSVLRGYNGTTIDAHAANAAVTEFVLLNASTTLDGDLGAAAQTMVVTVPNTGFPAAPFTVQIGTEQLRVTGTDAFGNWTIIRGFNGTEAADHAAGAVVVSVNTPDVYSNPSPNGSAGKTITGVPFASPFNPQTLPLIIPGLHVTRTSAPDANGSYVAPSTVTTTLNQLSLAGGLLPVTEGAGTLTVGTLLDPNNPAGMAPAPNNTVQTITVTASTPPGLILPFVATIQLERMQVTAINGNQWTVIRGIGGTAAVAHLPGTPITYAPALVSTTSITAPIAAAAANAVDTFAVPAGASLGTAVPFLAQIGNEIVRVTAVNGTQWSVVRGINGTTPVAQPANTPLRFNVPITSNLPMLVRVNNEIMEIRSASGSQLSVARAQQNTLAVAHAGDSIVANVGGIDSATTRIRVSSSVGFPTTSATNPFTIQIGGEMMSVTAVNPVTNIWTVVRGINGTTIPDDHSFGSVVTFVPTTNVAVNRSASFVDITFDRTVNPATFDAGDVLGVTGPLGAVAGPFTVSANPPGTPATMLNRVFRIGFPTQTLSGNYTVAIAPTISDTSGNQVDQNLNAGLDLLRGLADPNTTTLERPVYSATPNLVIGANRTVSQQLTVTDAFNIVQSTSQLSFTGPVGTSIVQPGGLLANTPNQTTLQVLSNIGFPSTTTTGRPFVVRINAEQIQVLDNLTTTWSIVRGFNGTTVASHAPGAEIKLGEPNTIQVLLGVTHGDVRQLSATLTAPDGTVVNLFNTGSIGRFGTNANLVNTIFDDSATTPVQNAPSPIPSGPFNPQFPLSVLNGRGSAGVWTLTIRNTGTTTGVLNRLELRLPKTVPSNGIGEPTADRISAGFRIFTFASTNPQSYDQWTPVGPVGNVLDPATNGDNGGPVHSVTLDPSDPSGNTAYAGASTGGIWKTTNFLTNDPAGPNWLPLTDFGPGLSLNIGSIAVFPRNNDPTKTVILAATGNSGSVTQTGNPALPNTLNTTGGPGVGFLRSQDGGLTWQVLDSTTNVDANGNILTMASPARDHLFVGTSGRKIIFDPTPLPNGGIVAYAALSGTNGGIYRTLNGGNTWQLIRAGDATDVVLGAASRNNNGNLTLLYGAFRGEGVFRATGDAPSTAGMTLLTGTGANPVTPRINLDVPTLPQLPTLPAPSTPTGNKGNIVLATPSLTNTPLADTFYQGWVYAVVADAQGAFDGLYVTKDFGFTWTNIDLPVLISGFATNDDNSQFIADPLSGNQRKGNYALSITVDPNNPNVVYLGGANGVLRVDITKIDDPYTLDAFINDDNDGGQTQGNTQGATVINSGLYGIVVDPTIPDIRNGYFNLYREPTNPFVSPSSLGFTGVVGFLNSGTEISWKPFSLTGASNYHQIVAVKDPLSGATRLVFANDSGLQYAVDDGTGNYITNLGNSVLGTGYRNGNMQTAQITAGSSQPSALAAALAGSLFYGSSTTINGLSANPNLISTGDLRWSGTTSSGSVVSSTSVALGRVTGAAGVGADQTGTGTVYRFITPSNTRDVGLFLPTDFFQFTPAGAAAISRVSGLVQGGDNPNPQVNSGQWPTYQGSNFAVNPIDTTGLIIASQQGRIFRTAGPTTGSGVQWFQTAATGQTGPAPALAFGALNTVSNTRNDFFYVGYESGQAFVTFDAGSTWRNISAGLDGSAVAQIVTNPTTNSREAYAVTQNAVYWMKDSSATGASWVRISDNLGIATTLASGLTASATTMAVTSRVGFPTAPFVVQLGTGEQVLVTAATTNSWTIQRGYNNTTPVAAGATTQVQLFNPLFGLTSRIFNVNGDTAPTLKFLTSIQADWRFAIPDSVVTTTLTANMTATQTTMTVASNAGLPPTPFIVTIGTERIQVNSLVSVAPNAFTYSVTRGIQATTASPKSSGAVVTPTGGTHPVLYVGGAGGVFRSRDKGQTWELYPSMATDGAVMDGGLMPNVQVTSLNLSLGNINTQTGFADTSSGYNMLLASTFGRGDFAIRLDNTPVAQFTAVPNNGPRITNFSPFVQQNGSQFSGFTVTFGGAVDPTTFSAADVTITGPNGAVPLSPTTGVVDLLGALPNNQYRINFATPQSSVGDYIIRVGPNVLDFSGNAMDQNNNNVNGEATADVYTNTFRFTSNTPPTISAIAMQTVNPGASTAPIPFTIGDRETPAAGLTLTPAPFVTTQPGFNGPAPTLLIGGTGANRTVTVTGAPNSRGTAIVTITVQDADGLQTATTFTVNVDTAPVIPPVNPLTTNHGTAPAPINLNATDADEDAVTFTVSFNDPLFAIKQQYGLGAAPVQQLFNTYGQGEIYLPAPRNTPFNLLVLTPDGKLYDLYNGTAAGSRQVGSVPTTVYQNPDLLLTTTGTPLVSLPNPLFDFQQKYGLTIPAAFFNFQFANEYYLQSSKGLGFFILTSSNTLLTYPDRQLVADFNALGYGNVYADPTLITSAKLLTAPALTATTTPKPAGPGAGGSVTITPNPAFVGTVGVTVTGTGLALSSSRTFDYTVNNVAPAFANPGPRSSNHTAGISVPTAITDPDPDTATRTVTVDFSNPLYDIRTQFAFNTPALQLAGNPAKYILSSNNSNPAGSNYFYILPDNRLYRFGTNTLVQDLSEYGDVYTNPTLITKASPVPPTASLNSGPLYDLRMKFGLNTAPQFFNNSNGRFEMYFASDFGGFFVLVPNNAYTDATLAPWDGVSINTSLASTRAVSVGIDPYFSPTLLYRAEPTVIGDPLFALRQKFGLNFADNFFNFYGMQEKNLYSAVTGAYSFFIKPDGVLYRSSTTTPAGIPVATVGVAVYNDPKLLYNSTGQAPAVVSTSTVAGSTLNLALTPNVAFAGAVKVNVRVSDGAQSTSQSFVYTVTNAAVPTAPTPLPTPVNRSVGSTGTSVSLAPPTFFDGNGDPLTYTAVVADPLVSLQAKYAFTSATGVIPERDNSKALSSGNGSNLRGSGFFLIKPVAGKYQLIAWDGSVSGGTVVYDDVGLAVYNNPLLLINATAPAALAGVATTLVGTNLSIAWPNTYTGSFLVDVYASDGNATAKQSFLVRVA